MTQVLNALLNAFSFYTRWTEQLKSLNLSKCTLYELLDASDEIFINPLIIFDSSDSIVALSSAYRNVQVDENWFELINNKATFPEKIVDFHDHSKNYFDSNKKEPFFIPSGLFPNPSYSQNLFYQKEWCGICVLIQYQTPFHEGYVHLLRILSTYIQLWINQRIDADIFQMNATYLAGIINKDTTELSQLTRKLLMLGWKTNDEMILLNARALSPNFHAHSYMCRVFSGHSPFIYAAAVDQSIILLCNTSQLAVNDLLGFLKPWFKKSSYYCGVSYPFKHISKISDANQQAEIALTYAKKAAGCINRIDNCAVYWMVDSMKEKCGDFSGHPILEVIENYDKTHHTNYYQTLFCFLRNERNHTATANELNIHRNTLFHRLERLQEYFHIDLDTPEERFYMQLSFYMKN